MAEAVAANVPATTGGDEPKKPLFGLTFLENLSDMSMLRQIGLLVGLAASVAIGFAVVLWSQQPDYRPLYGSLNGMDASQVVETLTASGIDYTIEPNSGALLVKADDLARARMRLAAAGVAPTDNSVGFEILDREQGLGTSQFMEATRYRRGLEGELARTVASLNNDGFGENIVTGDPVSNKDTLAYRPALGAYVTDAVDLQFALDHVKDNSGVRGAQMREANRFVPNTPPLDSRYDVRNGMPNVNETTMSGASITANLGDTKSTITHPATTTHGRISPQARATPALGDGLLKVNVKVAAVQVAAVVNGQCDGLYRAVRDHVAGMEAGPYSHLTVPTHLSL